MKALPPIRVQDVWARGCPLLRHAYDLQTLAAAGVHPRDIDTHIDHWRAYDARERRRRAEKAHAATLLAEIAAFHVEHPPPDKQPIIVRRHAPRPRPPRQAAA